MQSRGCRGRPSTRDGGPACVAGKRSGGCAAGGGSRRAARPWLPPRDARHYRTAAPRRAVLPEARLCRDGSCDRFLRDAFVRVRKSSLTPRSSILPPHFRGAAMKRFLIAFAIFAFAVAALSLPQPQRAPLSFAVTFDKSLHAAAIDGRLLVMLSTDPAAEPRMQISDGPNTQLVFGVNVENCNPAPPPPWTPTPSANPFRARRSRNPANYPV